MKIIAYIRTNSGPCYHRIQMPIIMMDDRDVLFANDLVEEHYSEETDIVLYNRVLGDEYIARIRDLRKKFGFKIVVDVDDIWHLDEHHISYQGYIDEGFARRQIDQVRYADVVITTHDRLAKYIAQFNKNVHVCPNAIPNQGQYDIKKIESPLIRLFWQGSITHKEDIRIIERPLEAIGSISTKVKMILGGYTRYESPEKSKDELFTEREWNEMAMVYTAKAKHQYELLPPEPVTNYYSMYAHADICLIPLVNSFFNRMKSNLKVLEAANLQLPVIASDVHPYKSLPIRYCRNSTDWIRHIKELVQYPERRRQDGLELADYCNEFFNFGKINLTRKQILESVCKQKA